VPRLINIMAHKSLLLAFGEGVQQVLPRHVRIDAADTPVAGAARWRLFALFAVLTAVAAVAIAVSVGWPA
jgi:MSHA biogenesis protein MshM